MNSSKRLGLIVCALSAIVSAIFFMIAVGVFGAQHCINVESDGDVTRVNYSSPDSLGAIVVMLDFGNCTVDKVKWEKPVPGTELDVIYINGNQVTIVCLGIEPRISSGQNVELATIYLLDTGQSGCNPDTFTNASGSRTCMGGVHSQTIHPDINFIFTDVGDSGDEFNMAPGEFSIGTYPNPFNPSVMIRYDVPERSEVKIVVYNLLGQEVACLTDSEHSSGTYYISWDARQASGAYFIKMSSPGFTEVRKVVLLK